MSLQASSSLRSTNSPHLRPVTAPTNHRPAHALAPHTLAVPNEPSPISEHSAPPAHREIPTNSSRTPAPAVKIATERKPHTTKENPSRLSVSAPKTPSPS